MQNLRILLGLFVLAIVSASQACNVEQHEICPASRALREGEPCNGSCTWCYPDPLDAGEMNGVCAASLKANVPSAACHFGVCRRACSKAQPMCKTGICCVMQVPDVYLADACGVMEGTACVPEAECDQPASFAQSGP